MKTIYECRTMSIHHDGWTAWGTNDPSAALVALLENEQTSVVVRTKYGTAEWRCREVAGEPTGRYQVKRCGVDFGGDWPTYEAAHDFLKRQPRTVEWYTIEKRFYL